MNKHIKIIMIQVIFLVLVFSILYFLYPRTNVEVEGNLVNFRSVNANVIIISESPDFSNPRYLDLAEGKNASINLKPGAYYWKAGNNLIQGWRRAFKIDSEVGMEIKKEENESELVNIGNVKINVTKSKEGTMIGYIILEPNQSEEIEDSGKYTGRQE